MNVLMIRNFKITIFLKNPILLKEKSICKVIKKFKFFDNNITSTIYKHSPLHIHLTGLKNLKILDKFIPILEREFQCTFKQIRFDSFFLTTKLNSKIDLERTLKRFKKYKIYFPSYEVDLFPSLIVKSRVPKKYPTCFIFQSGSLIILAGSKSIKRTGLFLKHILELIELKDE